MLCEIERDDRLYTNDELPNDPRCKTAGGQRRWRTERDRRQKAAAAFADDPGSEAKRYAVATAAREVLADAGLSLVAMAVAGAVAGDSIADPQEHDRALPDVLKHATGDDLVELAALSGQARDGAHEQQQYIADGGNAVIAALEVDGRLDRIRALAVKLHGREGAQDE
jgi:hypothetical protein